MLILGRHSGESLIIHDDVIVTVVSIHGNQVRLGITAPKEIAVHREEIYQRIQNEKNKNLHEESSTQIPVPMVTKKRKRMLNTANS